MMPMSAAVMALKDLHFEGNITPIKWYNHIRHDNGKPDLNAIIILSNIVSEYEQQSKDNLLQKNYQYYVDLFGLSKRQVSDAFVRLEQQGFIKRIFRHVKILGSTIANVLFIEINFTKVNEISKDLRTKSTQGEAQ